MQRTAAHILSTHQNWYLAAQDEGNSANLAAFQLIEGAGSSSSELVSKQAALCDVSRFKSWRAHPFPEISYNYGIEDGRSESRGVCRQRKSATFARPLFSIGAL